MDQAPRPDVFRNLVINAFEPVDLIRFCEVHPPFNELTYRFGPNDGKLEMADEVWSFVKMYWLWDEFFDAVAKANPRVFNRFAADLGLPAVEIPATPPTLTATQPEPTEAQPAPAATPSQPSAPPPETRYVDFEVRVVAGEGNRYRVDANSTLAGDATGELELPWSDDELREMAVQLENQETEREDLVEIGDQLYRALFQGNVQARYIAAMSQVEGDDRLRLRLQMEPAELQALPWELLYDAEQDEFLALSGTALITRYLAAGRPTPPLTVTPPLVILVAVASPADLHPILDVEAEVAAVRAALAPLESQGLVRVETLRNTQVWSLRDALRDVDPHVLHFVGHGDVGPRGGALMLEGDGGRSKPLRAKPLSTMLKRSRVSLAVVNACLSGRDASIEAGPLQERRQAVIGVGHSLVKAGLGAVVANQFSVDDEAARFFAQDFYMTLARFEPLDEAVSRAREALMLEYDDGAREWATPVLLMRAPDGIIFARPEGAVPAPATVAPQPAPATATPRPTPESAPTPDLPAMQQELNRRFDDPGLNSLCLLHFPTVFDLFTRGMRKDEKITLLLDHCRRDPAEWERLQQALEH